MHSLYTHRYKKRDDEEITQRKVLLVRPRGSENIVDRRRKAINLVLAGFSLNAAARRIGCAPSSVMRWWYTYRRYGDTYALSVRKILGRPPRLSTAKLILLLRQLRRGARASGYATEVWTTRRVAEVIVGRFHISYHRSHVGRIMTQCGWHYDVGRKTWEPLKSD